MKNLLFLFALLACFTACSNNDDDEIDPGNQEPDIQEPIMPEAPKIGTIAFADVTDAVALYITASASAGEEGAKTRAASETISNSLFKITGSGETVKVRFTSEEQDSVGQPQVFFIKDLSEKYIYMSYNNIVAYDTIKNWEFNETTYKDTVIYEFRPCWEHTQVLVKKDDGAVFKIESKETWGDNTYDSYEYWDLINADRELQVDYNGNVYVLYTPGSPDKIMKIYTHGKEVYLTQINRDDMDVNRDWLVDQQGNVIINETYTRLASGEFTRSPELARYNWKVFTVYNDSEGFFQLSSSERDENDGRMRNWIQYCQAESPSMSWKDQIQISEDNRIDRFRVFSYKDKTIVLIKYYGHHTSQGYYIDGAYVKLTIYDRNRVEEEVLEDCVLLELGGSSSDWGYKYYGNTHPCTEKYAYKVTDQQIWRAEIETGKAELLYDYGKEYMIKSIKVKNNIVTCDAFELRRGNDVVMEIYEDKSVHLVESVNNDKIIYLERLN